MLALWTILEIRWPVMAEHLAEHPDEVEHVRLSQPPAVATGSDVLPLYQSPEVRRLINGDAPDVHTRPDAATIRQCTGSMGGGTREVMA